MREETFASHMEQPGGISRRTFIQAASGSLVALPTLAGGLVLAPRPAYADEANSQAPAIQGSEYVVIDVVYPYEVGFMVVDVTKGKVNDAGMVSYPPVEGARVTVTSRFNGNTVTGKNPTDKDGVVNIDIRQLAVVEKGEGADNRDLYYFNGSITVEKDGWRRFQTAKVAIEGGTGLQVPAHPIDASDKPYPLLVSFDDWDALYSKNEFLITPANTDDHTVNVSILGLSNDKPATIELWVDGEKSPRQSAQATFQTNEQHLATASFTQPFLKKGDPAALPIGVKCKIAAKQGDETYLWPLAFTTSEGVVDEPSDKEGQKLSPFNSTSGSQTVGTQSSALTTQGTTGLDVKWPDNIPLVGGGGLNFWTPELPIGIYVNPYGMVQITLKSPSWGYLNDGGASDKNGWGKYPLLSVEKQWDKKVKTLKTMTDKTANLVSKPGAVQQIDLFKSFSATVNFQLMALAKWDSSKGNFQGEAAGQIVAAMNFTITENFFAGPIPVLITFALDANLIFGLAAAGTASKKNTNEKLLDAVLDLSRWQWDYTNTGFTMTLNITPSLSVGVGIRGVASISVKGSITLTLFFGVPMGTQPKSLPNPHFAAGWSAQISLVIEIFLFTHSFSLYNKSFSNFYDNWNGAGPAALKSQAEEEAVSALANASIGELLGQMTPITDEMLKKTSEAKLSTQGLTTQSTSDQDEPVLIDWDEFCTRKTGLLNDETPIEFIVYDLAAAMEGKSADRVVGPGRSGDLVAASSPDLQPDSSNGQADGLQTQAAVPGVSWLSAQSASSLPKPGVKALGTMGGIRPSSDLRIFEHVFANPRAKVAALGTDAKSAYEEGTWCFRIASVDIGGGDMRTRIVANCIYGEKQGASRIIEFDTKLEGAPHNDLYDYDFDLAVGREKVNGGLQTTVQLAIISGKRQGTAASVLENAACDLVVSALKFDASEFPGDKDVVTPKEGHSFSRAGNKLTGDETEKRHSILSIQIGLSDPEGPHSGQVNEPGALAAIVMFIDRCANSPEDVLGENAQVRLGIMKVSWENGDATIVNAEHIAQDMGKIDSTVYEMVLYPFFPEYFPRWTFMLRGAKAAYYFLIKIGDLGITVDRTSGIDPAVRLVPCPAQNYYLTSYPDDPAQLTLAPDKRDYSKWTLHKAWFKKRDNSSDVLLLNVAPIGPTGFNVVNFAVNRDGTFIFWPQSRGADEDRVWDASCQEDVKTRPAVYQIMACRIRGDRFSDPFVVADLPHDADTLVTLDTNQDAILEALITEHVDTGERDKDGKIVYCASDIWYTSVPAVRCATATACEAENEFVMPGSAIKFHVAVRNDGNVFLAGCTLALCVLNEATDSFERVQGATAKVSFSKETIRESHYNRSDGKGGLLGLEDDYALAPGKTSVYGVSVTIPTSWESGPKKVLFVASDAVQASNSSVRSQGTELHEQADGDDAQSTEPEAIEFHIEPGDYNIVQVRTATESVQDPNQRHMDTLHVAASGASGSFDSSPLLPPNSSDGADGSGGSGGSDNRAMAPSPRGSLSSAGDALSLGPLALALAAAGAAAAVYERRRAQNESNGAGATPRSGTPSEQGRNGDAE